MGMPCFAPMHKASHREGPGRHYRMTITGSPVVLRHHAKDALHESSGASPNGFPVR